MFQFIGQGEFAEVYTDGVRAYKHYKTEEVTPNLLIQNSITCSPRAYSFENKILVQELILGVPIHCAKKVNLESLRNIGKELKQSGISHNDINSGNIIVDKEGNCFLIDFDLASYGNNPEDYEMLERIEKFYASKSI